MRSAHPASVIFSVAFNYFSFLWITKIPYIIKVKHVEKREIAIDKKASGIVDYTFVRKISYNIKSGIC